ncbi:MAG: hypothetical protein IM571_04795 [Chitinophagaceae bacterium]|jgi:hypothetical protein|nr:hypothetical protein [Chitinophagaceae bacterium]MCA6477252.1 hypothetical protein [Chitinophagaceae bacterium]MCA6496410.1 hypothetical protein [Chitinophagaceae bacterium]
MLKSIISTVNVLAFFILIGCSNKNETKDLERQEILELKAELTAKTKLEEAKEIIMSIAELNNYFECVNAPVNCTIFNLQQTGNVKPKQMTKKEMDSRIIPLQRRLDSLRISLTAEEKKELNVYSKNLMKELNEITIVISDTSFLHRFMHIEPRYSL